MQLLKVCPSSPSSLSFFFFLFWVVGDGSINPSLEEMEALGRRVGVGEKREPRAPVEDHGLKRCRFGVVFYFFKKQKTSKQHRLEVFVFFFFLNSYLQNDVVLGFGNLGVCSLNPW